MTKETFWTIVDKASGEVLEQVVTSDGAHPKDEGVAFDDATMDAIQTTRQGDMAQHSFDGASWKQDAAKLDAMLLARIDREAAEMRAQYLTSEPGQDEVYRHKAIEARAYLSAQDPVAADYPFLLTESVTTSTPMPKVAKSVVGASDAWIAVAAAIEGARLGAKQAVRKARGNAKFDEAFVDWHQAVAEADIPE